MKDTNHDAAAAVSYTFGFLNFNKDVRVYRKYRRYHTENQLDVAAICQGYRTAFPQNAESLNKELDALDEYSEWK